MSNPSRRPWAMHRCPQCAIEFSASDTPNPASGKGSGKCCPNGHWTQTYLLYETRRVTHHLEKLQSLGVQRTDDALALALHTMVDCYEKALRTLPQQSVAHALLAGAFGKAPEVSKQILKIA